MYFFDFFLGRASQIRSMPFGDSSDDSSDGEEHPNQTETNTRITNSSSDNTDSSLGSGSSPSKSVKTTSSLSPAKRSSSGSPSKSVKRGKHFKCYPQFLKIFHLDIRQFGDYPAFRHLSGIWFIGRLCDTS